MTSKTTSFLGDNTSCRAWLSRNRLTIVVFSALLRTAVQIPKHVIDTYILVVLVSEGRHLVKNRLQFQRLIESYESRALSRADRLPGIICLT